MADRGQSKLDILRWLGHSGAHRGTAAWLKRFLAWITILLTVGASVGGYAFYRLEVARFETDKYIELAAVASMKVDLLERWRHERMSDSRRLAESETRRANLSAWLGDPDNRTLSEDLRVRLVLEKDTGEYADVFLVSPTGQLLLSARAAPGPLHESVRQSVDAALASTGPLVRDFYLVESGKVRIDVVQAVRDLSGRALAVVVLSSDASEYLYPMLRLWPTPSQSGETVLVRRDGDQVLFLNDLRLRTTEALIMRESLDRADLPAVQAVLGRAGRFSGSDYRGIRVFADLRGVPGTSWAMVTKIDRDEILTEVRFRAGAIGGIVVALILTVGAVAAYAYRTRQSTERTTAAAVIARSEMALRESQLVARLGHYTLDVGSGTWTSSEGLDAIFGIGPDFPRDVAGWTSLILPDDRAMMSAHLADDVLTKLLPFDREYRIVRPLDSAERWVQGLGTLEVGPDGRPARMFGTIQDVTERKRLQQELQARNEELVRFIYTVSHDLKSPLVTIQTFLGFLQEDRKLGDAARVEKDIGFIRRAGEKMAELLEDLLELSRIGRKMNPLEELSLQSVVKGALDMVAGRIAQRHVEVVVTDAPILLRGDRRRLLEVFENLLDNAAKFVGDQAAPRVEIGVDETGRQLVLFVRDNGAGIDPRHQSKLFGLFEKLHPESEGTGIGLALVKRIVEVHGGRIWAESDGPGLGSTFKFTLAGTCRQPAAEQQETQ
jgi:signal transduction histidine kinase